MIGRFALPLIAVLTLQASPIEMGLLRTADLLPALAFGLVAGVWVDRLRRRPIMIWADLGRGILLATIPLAAVLGALRIEQLYVIAVGVGALTILFEVAYRSYLPTLVSPDALVEGNAKLAATSAVVEVGGFGIAGALVQLLTAPITILVDALSFILSSILLVLIRHPESRPRQAEEHQNVWREMRAGLSVVLVDPILRPLAAAELTRQVCVQMWVAVLLLFLTRDLHLEPILFGPLFAIGGVSSLAGALAVERLVKRFGLGPTLVVSFGLGTVSLVVVPLAGGSILIAAALVGAGQLFDAAGTIAEITQRALVQSSTPAHLLGRVNASLQLIGSTAMLVGSLLGGVLGEVIGIRETMLIGAIGAVPSVLWLICSPIRRHGTRTLITTI